MTLYPHEIISEFLEKRQETLLIFVGATLTTLILGGVIIYLYW